MQSLLKVQSMIQRPAARFLRAWIDQPFTRIFRRSDIRTGFDARNVATSSTCNRKDRRKLRKSSNLDDQNLRMRQPPRSGAEGLFALGTALLVLYLSC